MAFFYRMNIEQSFGKIISYLQGTGTNSLDSSNAKDKWASAVMFSVHTNGVYHNFLFFPNDRRCF